MDYEFLSSLFIIMICRNKGARLVLCIRCVVIHTKGRKTNSAHVCTPASLFASSLLANNIGLLRMFMQRQKYLYGHFHANTRQTDGAKTQNKQTCLDDGMGFWQWWRLNSSEPGHLTIQLSRHICGGMSSNKRIRAPLCISQQISILLKNAIHARERRLMHILVAHRVGSFIIEFAEGC